ncbi:MAG: glycosyltransferase [Cytophagales bacterium]|nr:glycosyltransferase [Cytophagales bacterium]
MKHKPTVSVITVVYNDEKHIENTLKSVIGQRYPKVEYLVIDGNSTDQTSSIIARYANSIDSYVCEADRGIYDAMNKGLAKATGDYVLFMNSGDQFENEKVLENIFEKNDEPADIYYGETHFTDEKGKVLGTRSELTTRKLPEQLTAKSMLSGMVVCHQAILVKRALASTYDLRYKCSADIDWVTDALQKATRIQNTHMVIARYLTGGYSAINRRQAWAERFVIYGRRFGWFRTFSRHVFIAARYIAYKALGKKNL